jgi:8-oxo-dGTP pyrophosphatase MutT (NUDIX family)
MKTERPEPIQPLPPDAKRVFQGIIFDVYQWEQKMFDGSTATFERLKRPDTVVVIPVLADGRIVMIEEQQPGRPPFITFPGGRVDQDEDPTAAAKRELLEETGCVTNEDPVLWEAVQPVSKLDWAVYTFVAGNCRHAEEPNPDAGEKIKLKFLTFDEMLDVTTAPSHRGPEMELKFIRAKHDPVAMTKIKKLFGLK